MAMPGLDLMAMPGLDPMAMPGLDLMAVPGLDLMAVPGLDLMAVPGLDLMAMPGLDLMDLAGLNLMAMPGLDLVAMPGLDLMAMSWAIQSHRLGICSQVYCCIMQGPGQRRQAALLGEPLLRQGHHPIAARQLQIVMMSCMKNSPRSVLCKFSSSQNIH